MQFSSMFSSRVVGAGGAIDPAGLDTLVASLNTPTFPLEHAAGLSSKLPESWVAKTTNITPSGGRGV